jgi:hypothetical protein
LNMGVTHIWPNPRGRVLHNPVIYNLEKNIERTRQAMGNNDYDNVFNIVEQDKTPGSSEKLVLTKTRDLFKDYAIMTPDEVA